MPFEVNIPPFTQIRRRIDNAEERFIRDLAEFTLKEHRKRVANWTTPVDIQIEYSGSGSNLTFEIIIETDVWIWVNYGTGIYGPKRKRIKIKAKKKGGRLRFIPNYNPRTTSSATYGGSSTRQGNPVFAKEVTIRGTKPRRFDLEVAALAETQFYPKWPKVMKRAIFNK